MRTIVRIIRSEGFEHKHAYQGHFQCFTLIRRVGHVAPSGQANLVPELRVLREDLFCKGLQSLFIMDITRLSIFNRLAGVLLANGLQHGNPMQQAE